MSNSLKVFLVAVCVLAIVLGFKFWGGSQNPQSASAFEWEKSVSVYFGNTQMGSSEDCAKVFPLARTILNAETFGPGALEVLLQGPTQAEKDGGYFTSVNEGVLIQKFEIKDQTAYVDLNEKLNEGVAGSCRVQNLKAQIETTLNSLPDIDSVVLSVNGKSQGILEP